MLLHYLVKVETAKMHANTASAFNANYKIPLNESNYIDSFIKCFVES